MLEKLDDKDILVMQYRQGKIYPWENSDILRWTKYAVIQYFSQGRGEHGHYNRCYLALLLSKRQKKLLS